MLLMGNMWTQIHEEKDLEDNNPKSHLKETET